MTSDSTEYSVGDILQRAGRNLLAFQQTEALLKLLVANSHIDAPLKTFLDAKQKRIADFDDKTMGQAMAAFLDTVYTGTETAPALELDITEVWITIRLRVDAAPDYVEQRKVALRNLVKERNHLVHKMLLPLKEPSPEVCESLCRDLDKQAVLIEQEFSELRNLAEQLVEGRRLCAEEMCRRMEDGNVRHGNGSGRKFKAD